MSKSGGSKSAQGEPAQGEPAQGEPAQGEPAQGEPAPSSDPPQDETPIKPANRQKMRNDFKKFVHNDPTDNANFFLERVPYSVRPSAVCISKKCRDEPLRPGDYRITVYPSNLRTVEAACYHVTCFEEALNMSHIEHVQKMVAVDRNTYPSRGLTKDQVKNRDYLLDGGMERLFYVWHHRKLRQLQEHFQLPIHGPLDPGVEKIWYEAGETGFFADRPQSMSGYEYQLLITTLAPNEVSANGSPDSWNLFYEYLPNPISATSGKELTTIATRWHRHKLLAQMNDTSFREVWGKLGALDQVSLRRFTKKVIRRLSKVPLPAD